MGKMFQHAGYEVRLGPVALPWALALLYLRDVGGWLALRGAHRLWIPLALAPLREPAIFLVWLVAPLERYVTWRGHGARLGAGTLLFAPSRDARAFAG
jgi:hypothetical protein